MANRTITIGMRDYDHARLKWIDALQKVGREKLADPARQKAWEQASNFALPQLEEIYRRLLETDIAIKTGKSEPVVALDVLVVELTR